MTMNSNAFEFTMQITAGRALLGAVRDLASHVATYAGGKSVAATVADEVVTAAEAAIAATRDEASPIDFRFLRSPEALDIYISCANAPTLAATHLSRGPGLSVDWQPSGTRQVCHIRQLMD
jgi:hypothetical protein